MPFKILTVCTGNICRSPSAEVILRDHLAAAGLGDLVEVDSAGTADYHIGEPPSDPAMRLGAQRGYDLSPLRARQITAADFDAFDLILVMDRGHLDRLSALQPAGAKASVRLFLDLMPPAGAKGAGAEVADPYYGGDADYAAMFDVIEAAVPSWIAHLQGSLRGPA
ncbi:MAG: low molecular weight protein-tyrosine-phosphatase [Kiloniellaceae bacterium]